IDSVIASVIHSAGLTRSYNGMKVIEQWTDIAGEELAAHAVADRFENGTLFVLVEDDAWRQTIEMEKEMLLKKIRSLPFGRSVREIRLTGSRKG
ncbi:MAG: DUF721 domain-containing protein, partial [candidate division Zixibacteria bacterium]